MPSVLGSWRDKGEDTIPSEMSPKLQNQPGPGLPAAWRTGNDAVEQCYECKKILG